VALATPRTQYLYVVRAVFTDPDLEAEWNDWYDRVHVPELLGVPGFVSATRFRQLGLEGHYLAIYEIESPNVFAEPRYAQITGWGKWAPMIAQWSRSVQYLESELPIVNYVDPPDKAVADLN
jgi:hypothetical protein